MKSPVPARRFPPLSALRPFEAAARHLSFTAAARELNVTQAAVSRQIAQLEHYFDQPLFTRAHRAVQLTSRGRRLHHAVAEALDILALAGDEMREESTSTELRIATDVPFAHLWLSPRLPAFMAAHPGINPCITASNYEPDCLSEEIEVAILYGGGQWSGHRADFLFDEEVFPVCTPGYLRRHGPIELHDLPAQRLLDLTGRWDWISWRQWLAAQGVQVPAHLVFQESNDWPLLIQGARQGNGIALAWRYLIDELLDSGELVRVTDCVLRTERCYYLVRREGIGLGGAAAAFCDWVLGFAAATPSETATSPASGTPPTSR